MKLGTRGKRSEDVKRGEIKMEWRVPGKAVGMVDAEMSQGPGNKSNNIRMRNHNAFRRCPDVNRM